MAGNDNGCEGNFGETMRYLEETQGKKGVTTAKPVSGQPDDWGKEVGHEGEPKPTASKIGS